MQIKVQGIMIKSVDYKDNDKILTIFSKQSGLLTAGIKGVKKAGAKLKFCAMPFCYAEYVLNTTSNRNTVIGASAIDNFFNLKNDIVKYYTAFSLIEYINSSFLEGVENQPLFDFTLKTLKLIEEGEKSNLSDINSGFDVRVYLVKFLLFAIEMAGYKLSLSKCLSCDSQIEGNVFLSVDMGGVTCGNCFVENSLEFKMDTYKALMKIDLSNIDDLANLSFKKPDLNNCIKLLKFYVSCKEHIKINSRDTLLTL